MPAERVNIPVRGATDTARFRELPAGFAPVGSMLNVLPYTAAGRQQMGTRGGVTEVFAGLGGMIQSLAVLNRPSVSSGFTLGSPVSAGDGISRSGAALEGNLWVMEDNPRPTIQYRTTFDTVIGAAAPFPNVTAVCFSPDGTLLLVGHTEINVYGKYMVRIRCLDAATGEEEWTVQYNNEGTTQDFTLYAGCLVCSKEYAFFGAKSSLQAIRLTGANASRITDCGTLNGWCQEIVALGVYDQGGAYNEALYACFQGTRSGNQTDFVGGGSFNGAPLIDDDIDSGDTASHYRAGVMKFSIPRSTDNIGAVRRVSFGTQLAVTAPGSEYTSTATPLPHNYYRFADQSVQRPHGCVVTDMAVGADGSVVVTRSNQGWGPNATPWRPGATGGSYTPPVPDVTITKINRDGVTVFEIDPGSNKFDGLGAGYNGTPHYNDINAPTFRAVAIDANGAVYAAGYQSPSGYSVARISSTGGVDWRKNVVNAGAAVSLSAIAVDPTDGNLIVCTPYNRGWDGATRSAHIFKLAASDGRIIWNFTATPGVAALAVAVSRTGRIAFGTDYPS